MVEKMTTTDIYIPLEITQKIQAARAAGHTVRLRGIADVDLSTFTSLGDGPDRVKTVLLNNAPLKLWFNGDGQQDRKRSIEGCRI